MNKKAISSYLFSTAGVIIVFFIVLAAYLLVGSLKLRIDLTEEKLYTLSDGTKAILAKLDTPVEIRLYCTKSSSLMPVSLKSYSERVEDILNEYKKISRGLIEIKKLDPQPDTDAEDSAVLDGIEGQMLPTGEKVYLGLAVNCLDTKVSLPFLSPDREKLLEYDITRAIAQATKPSKPVIGIMSTLPVFGQFNPMMMRMGGMNRQNPWIFVSELKKDFDVKQVDLITDKIDDEINLLIVIHPKDLAEKTQFAIDQFLLRGGKLIVFLDPACISDQGNSMNPLQGAVSNSSSFDKFLKAWGLNFDNSKVLADLIYASQVSRGQATEVQRMPTFLSVISQGLNTNDIVTSQIDSLLLPFAGVFTGTPAEGLQQTILISSTEKSQLIDKMTAMFANDQVLREFAPSGKPYPIALRLKGKFKTAFPEGKPKDKSDENNKTDEQSKNTDKNENWLKESEKESVAVLVGDADLLNDQFCVRVQSILGQRFVIPVNGNLTLVQGLVEQMSGDLNLITIRGRATKNRPFEVVREIQAKAEEQYRSKLEELQKSLNETQQRLNELQQKNTEAGQRFILSPEQKQAIENFKAKEREIKTQLKIVKKNLRRDIDSLETRLKWLNIAGMPFLVTLSGLTLAYYKRKKSAEK